MIPELHKIGYNLRSGNHIFREDFTVEPRTVDQKRSYLTALCRFLGFEATPPKNRLFSTRVCFWYVNYPDRVLNVSHSFTCWMAAACRLFCPCRSSYYTDSTPSHSLLDKFLYAQIRSRLVPGQESSRCGIELRFPAPATAS